LDNARELVILFFVASEEEMANRRANSVRVPRPTFRQRPKAPVKNVPPTRRPDNDSETEVLYDLLDYLAEDEDALAA
jgi:hypothetical protein